MATRILLADDHLILRQGLRLLLDREPDLHVCGEAADGRQAVDGALELQPDVIVMDLSMPILNGIDATRHIRQQLPHARVIILSAYNDRNRIAEAIRAGAVAYLLKVSAFEELASAVRKVAAGERYLGPGVSEAIVNDYMQVTQGLEQCSRLSGREREVLQLLAEGKATKEAAAALHLSTKTVETHRRSIMEKLKMYSIAELTKHALREGLTTLER